MAKGSAAKSPQLTAGELKGKNATQIRALAKAKRLVPHATKPDKWMDPVTGKERLRLDPGHVDKKTGFRTLIPRRPSHTTMDTNPMVSSRSWTPWTAIRTFRRCHDHE